jgi:PhnB protein
MIVDPFGHRWMLSQKLENVEPEEMQRRWNEETGA